MVYKHRTKSGKIKHYQSKGHYQRALKGYFASQNRGNKVGRVKARTKSNAYNNRRKQYNNISGRMKHRGMTADSLKALNNDLKNLEFLIKEEKKAKNSDPKFLRNLRALFTEMKVALQIVQMEKAAEEEEKENKKKGKKLKHKVAFVTEADFHPYAHERIKEGGWGDADNYGYSKEYADEYEMLKKLWTWEDQAKRNSIPVMKGLLTKKGLSEGDNVFMDYISESGQTTFTGNVKMIGGRPYVKLPNGREILWHIGWNKSSSIKEPAKPIFDSNEWQNQGYARRLAIKKFLSFSQEQQEKDLGENAPVIFDHPTKEWFDDPKKHDIDRLDTKTKAVFGKTDALRSELRHLPRKPKGKRKQ
jgi:hypothetical protein